MNSYHPYSRLGKLIIGMMATLRLSSLVNFILTSLLIIQQVDAFYFLLFSSIFSWINLLGLGRVLVFQHIIYNLSESQRLELSASCMNNSHYYYFSAWGSVRIRSTLVSPVTSCTALTPPLSLSESRYLPSREARPCPRTVEVARPSLWL